MRNLKVCPVKHVYIPSPFTSVVCKNESQIFCLIKVIIHPYENINVTSFLNKKKSFTNQDEQKKIWWHETKD